MGKTQKNWLYAVLGIVLGGVLCGTIVYNIVGNNKTILTNKGEKLDKNTEECKEVEPANINEFDVTAGPLCKDVAYVTVVTSEGEVYASVKLTKHDAQITNDFFGDGTYDAVINSQKSYADYKLDSFTIGSEKDKSINGIKLNISNVDKVYEYAAGQTCSTNTGLIFVKEDGTVSAISYYSILTGKTAIYNISGLQNISSVELKSMGNAGVGTVAIDKSGTEYNLYNYLPTNHKEW